MERQPHSCKFITGTSRSPQTQRHVTEQLCFVSLNPNNNATTIGISASRSAQSKEVSAGGLGGVHLKPSQFRVGASSRRVGAGRDDRTKSHASNPSLPSQSDPRTVQLGASSVLCQPGPTYQLICIPCLVGIKRPAGSFLTTIVRRPPWLVGMPREDLPQYIHR